MRTVRVSLLVFLVSLAMAASAAAQVTLYAGVGAGSSPGPLYSVNPATGAGTPIGSSVGFGLTGLAEHPITGVMYGVTTGTRNLVIVNKATGVGTLVGSTVVGIVADLTFRSDGTLFGWTESGDDLVTFNLGTGAATIVANSGISTFGSGLAFNASDTLYFAGNGVNGNLYTVNPTTGLPTVGPLMTGAPALADSMAALAFHPVTGVLYGVALEQDGTPSRSFLVTINVTTGVITTVGSLPDRIDAIAFGVAGVPTMPEGLLLMLTAMLAAGAVFMMLRRNARLA